MADMAMPGKEKSQRCMRYLKKHSLKVDMTPMADLGFLLITFFVFTTELSKPMSTDLYMPADGKPMNLAESKALTILLTGSNRIIYYHGNWEHAVNKNEVYETGFSYSEGIGKIIRGKQEMLEASDGNAGKKGLMMLIKPDENATYENLVDILDEVLINEVKKYAVLKLLPGEAGFLNRINRQR